MKWLLIKKLGMNSDASWLIIQKNMIIRLQKYLTISYHNNLLGELLENNFLLLYIMIVLLL